jgi:hypothetical protein
MQLLPENWIFREALLQKTNAEVNSNDKNLLKEPVIADSRATCHMRGSLEGMFDMKPYVTDIMVGNNETMASVSKGQ